MLLSVTHILKKSGVSQNQKTQSRFNNVRDYFRILGSLWREMRIAAPLSDLLKADSKFVLDQACKTAFEYLKCQLMKAPILCIYDLKRETELHTDASSKGFGAALMQKQDDGKFHPVAFYSKKATDQESRYHSFELETLAIVYALRRFETFLKGLTFKVITDCSALQQTLKKKHINPRIARWAFEFEEYNMNVLHRSGVNMGHVDALS